MTNDERHYQYPPTGERFVSVTTVLSATESKPYLAPASAKRAATWAADNMHQLGKLGRDEFIKQAAAASDREWGAKRDAGTSAHDVVEKLILWQASPGSGNDITLPSIPDELAGAYVDDMPVEDFVEACSNGFLNFCNDHDPLFEASEMTVFHPALRYAGTLDIRAYLRKLKVRSTVDVKTGKWLDQVREQLGAYRRAPEGLLPMGELAEMPPTDAGHVLHLRPEYPRGYRLMEVSAGDDASAWNTFRRALMVYQDRAGRRGKPGRVMYPPLPDGSQPPPLLADLDGDVHGRVLNPLIAAGLASISDVTQFTAADCLAIKGVGPKAIETLGVLLETYGLAFAPEKDGEVHAAA